MLAGEKNINESEGRQAISRLQIYPEALQIYPCLHNPPLSAKSSLHELHLLQQPASFPPSKAPTLFCELASFSSLSQIVALSSPLSQFATICALLRRFRLSACVAEMGLDEDFDKAAKDVKTLTTKPSDEDLLILYSLFKVATVGKVDTPRPGLLDFKGKAKWDAWKKVEDKDPEEAKKDYILKAQQLLEA